MAIYAKVNPNRPIENGCAVGWAPTNASTQGIVIQDGIAEKLDTMDSLQALLNGRYKTGGTTGWERPGSNLP